MKICIVTPTLSGGGAQKVAVNLANEWSQQGLNVELLVLRNTGVYFEQVSDRVQLTVLGVKRIRYALIPLGIRLASSNPDIVLSVIRDTNIYIGLLSLFFTNTKFYGREASTMEGVLKKKPMGRVFYLNMMRCLYNRIDGIIANSDYTYQDLLKYRIIPKQSCVVGNPVIDKNAHQLIKEDVDDDWLVSDMYRVVISVGRLTKEKNHSVLIKAFSQICIDNSDARLIIIGEGDEKNRLESLILRNNLDGVVKILPFQQNIYKFLKNAKVFVLPSLYEGFGNVVVEALFCGTEVVATRCPGGAVGILKNGDFGTIVKNNNIESLTQGIEFILFDKRSRRDEALKARAMNYTVTNVAKQYLDFMTS
jgi:glycosyltransferase involved in cell wall biosynthesis